MFKIVYANSTTKLRGNVQTAQKTATKRTPQTPSNKTTLMGNSLIAKPLKVKK